MLNGEKVYDSDEFDAVPVSIKSKNIENRHVSFSKGWYGVILGKGRKGDTAENYEMCRTLLPDMKLPSSSWPGLKNLRGCVVGIVFVSHSLPYEICKHSKWANGAPVCNIITKAGWLELPVPCKGNLGACPIHPVQTRSRVRTLAKKALDEGHVFDTSGGMEHPYSANAWSKKRKLNATISTAKSKEASSFESFFKKRTMYDHV